MKSIRLYNQTSKATVLLTVSEKNYSNIERLQYMGGIKRFGLAVYEEGEHLKEDDPYSIPKHVGKVFKNRA